MRILFAMPFVMGLAACTQQPAEEGNAAGFDNAVVRDTDLPGMDVNAAAPAATPTPEQADTAAEPGPEAAVAVLQRYFDAIGHGDYSAAWQLWDDGGAKSGMSVEEFGAAYGKYRSYKAEIGAPGRIDAGAGNRYITIPVVVTGRLKDGNRAFRLSGPVTLHRNANIPGTTEADRSWRIWSSDLDARPAEPAEAVAEMVSNAAVAP